ncbi:MAG: glycosyl hydrolase family 18 protein, partial [Sphingobacteriales bacterium]
MQTKQFEVFIQPHAKFPVFMLGIFWCLFLPAGCLHAQSNKVIIGYVGGFRGLVKTELIDAGKLTHINYAFVDIKNNRAWLHKEATDTINFRHLNLLKKQNPALKILISIGGWTWSGKFSDAVLSDTSRQGFAESAVGIVKKYDMDGID